MATNICRICIDTFDDLLPIAINQKGVNKIELSKLGTMFEESFGIEVSELPDYLKICMTCKIQLTYFYDFKKMALKSHIQLINQSASMKKETIEERDNQSLLEEKEDQLVLEENYNNLIVEESPHKVNTDQENEEHLIFEEEHSVLETNIENSILGEGNEDQHILDVINYDEDNIESIEKNEIKDKEIFLGTKSNDEDEASYNLDIEYLEDDLKSFRVMNLENDLPDSQSDQEDSEILKQAAEIEYNQTEDTEEDVNREEEDINLEVVEIYEVDSNEPKKIKKISKSSNTTCRIQYECKTCGKRFRNLEIFCAHINIHKGLPAFCCEICGKEFKFKVNYDYHMKNHNNNRSFKCSLCTKTCLSKWDLKLHMRSHLDHRPFECEICGKAFRVKSHMTDHLETHNKENNYVCPTCQQKYKTKASLKMHVTTVHLKTTQYPCGLCDKIFYRTYHLKIHQKVHMRNMENS